MSQNSTLRQPDAQFVAFIKDFYDYVEGHQVSWGLNDNLVKQLKSLTGSATHFYEKNMAPSTRNHLTAVDKKHAFGELKHFLSLFINALEGNPEVTDEDLDEMGLRPRIQPVHKPLPVPTEAPLIETDQQHDEITIYVTRIERGQPAHGAQLKPYHGFKLRWRFEDETEWHAELSTRLHYTIFFDAKDETRRVIITAAWVNPRLQEGPWTLPINMVVG
jgi:hypothetical protein